MISLYPLESQNRWEFLNIIKEFPFSYVDKKMWSDQLYKMIDVWKKIGENSAIRFRCFEIIGKNQFCVQSADFFQYPVDETTIKSLDKQLAELFIEEFPDKRNKVYASLEEAIIAHEKEFS